MHEKFGAEYKIIGRRSRIMYAFDQTERVLGDVCALIASCSSVGSLRSNALEMVIRVMIGCVSTNHKSDYKIWANSSFARRVSKGEIRLTFCTRFLPKVESSSTRAINHSRVVGRFIEVHAIVSLG